MRASLIIVLLAIGCKQESGNASSSASASASATALTSASSTASAASSAAANPNLFSGTYTATAGSLVVPDGGEWKGVKFRGDDAGALGDGTLTFSIDRDAGTIAGELDGPLGPATLNGIAAANALTFHVEPRNATDLSFSGTGTATLDGHTASGDMHMSSWRANVLRDATFHAQAK